MAAEKMPFTRHLSELRNRLMVSFVSVVVVFLVAFKFSERIFELLMIPMRSKIALKSVYPYVFLTAREGALKELVFLAPAEAFWVHLKISLIAAIISCLPLIFFEVWRFVSPGLLAKEKRLALPFIAVASGLFAAGTLFCFVIVLPFAMNFLLEFRTGSLTPMISVEKYIDFCLKFILAFGVVFELPVVMVFITRAGIVSIETLARNRKYAVLLAFVAAALLTPTPDAFNQSLMAVPIIFLYEGGLLVSKIFVKRKKDDKGKEPQGNGV
jgi:sec-independent protein translocase protein TatC